MFLMHQDDVHYSLMVHKDHDLFQKLSSPSSYKNPQAPKQVAPVNEPQSQEANLAETPITPQGNVLDPQDSTADPMKIAVKPQDQRVQSVDSESKCKVCKQQFTNNHHLKSHMKMAHANAFVSELEGIFSTDQLVAI